MTAPSGVAAAGAALLLAALAGCGGPARADVSVVSVTDGAFSPATLTVPAGTEVRWVNDGARTHTVTTEEGALGGEPAVPPDAGPFDSGPLRAGETFSHRFDVEGTYVYWCSFHRDEEMLGVVEVVAP